jgi:hypothetical protein
VRSEDQGALEAYFGKTYRRPRAASLLGVADSTADVGKEVVETAGLDASSKVGAVKKAFRRLSRGARFRTAAWLFLRPHPPLWNNLDALATSVGVDHLNRVEFCRRLSDECYEVVRTYPELTSWVYRRMALLDWILHDRPLDPSRREEAFSLRNGYDECVILSRLDADAAVEEASRLCRAAIAGAANAVVDALADAAGLSANLMIPLPRAVELPLRGAALTNKQRADRLWTHVGEHATRLIVIAESPGANHLGFWVPAITRQPGVRFPGATEAILGNSSAVLKRDLPKLEGASVPLQADWEKYMLNEFTNDLFVSLPIRPPGIANPVAVLNVNVNISNGAEREWYRAYAERWTRRAMDYSWNFVDLALRSLTMSLTRFRTLPPVELGVPSHAALMLPPGADETEPT